MERTVPLGEPWDAEELPRRLRDPGNPFALRARGADEIARATAANLREQEIPEVWIERVLREDGLGGAP